MKKNRAFLMIFLFVCLLLLLTSCVSGGGNGETEPPYTEPPPVTCLAHVWDEGIVWSEPTCSWEGTRAYTCTVCGEWRSEPIPTVPHTYDTEWTSDGRYHYHAALCGCYGERADLGEHTFDGGTVTRPPTCAADGERTYTCTVCGATETEAIARLAHTYESRWSYDDLHHWHSSTCSCPHTVSDRGAHTYDGGRVTLEPTCVREGVLTYTCTVCPDTRTEAIPATGEHIFDTVGEVTPPTCETEGYTSYRCLFCSETRRDTPTDRLPHAYEGVTVAPTCLSGGYTDYTCTACGDSYRGDEVAAVSHRYSSAVVPPTCTAGGYTEHTCIWCPASYRDTPTDRLPHSYESLTVPPTCAAEGYTEHTCSVCGDSYRDTAVAKLPHTYENIVCTGCGATEYSVGLDYTLSRDGSYYSISGMGSCRDTALVLPSVHAGLPVREIAASAFENKTAITSVSFRPGNTLEWIDSYAFYGCTALTSVEIPASVGYIGAHSFSGCTAMTASLPAALTVIDTSAFRNCRSLTSVTIPAGLVRIGSEAFAGCTGLRAVYLSDLAAWCALTFPSPDANPLSNAHALYLDGEPVTRLVIPEGVTAIGKDAFRDCPSILSVELPEGLTAIGERAFRSCTALASLTLPASVGTVGKDAFFGCTALSTLTFAEGSRCAEIGNAAFSGCTSLTSLSLPASVTALGALSFGNCPSIGSITVAPECTAYFSLGNCLIERASGTLILGCSSSVIPSDGSVTAIGERAFWNATGLTSVTIPREVTSVGAFAFLGCRGLRTVTFEEGSLCTAIGTRAFSDCRALTAMTIPFVGASPDAAEHAYLGYLFGASGVSENSFYVPSGLATLRILGGAQIPANALSNCTSIVSLSLPAELTAVGDAAFSGCTGLSALSLPPSLTAIGDAAFSGCTGLLSLSLPASLEAIGGDALRGCTSLTELTLPFVGASADGTENTHLGYLFGAATPADNAACVPAALASVRVTGDRIAPYAFLGCDLLAEVTLAARVAAVGEGAFSGCRVLVISCEAAEAPAGFASTWNGACPVVYACLENHIANDGYHYVKIDGIRYALAAGEATVAIQSNRLSAAVLPNAVTYLGISYPVTALAPDALRDCTALVSLSLPSGLETVGASALRGCTALSSVTLPASVTAIGEDAFLGCTALSGVYTDDLAAFLGIAFADADANPLTCAHSLYLGATLVTELAIPTAITELLPHALSGCTSLTELTVHAGVARIAHAALLGCTGLESLTVPFVGGAPLTAGITHLGYPFGALLPEENAAFVPPSLKSVSVTGGVSVFASAFSGCDRITEVLLPSGLNAIGTAAFFGCASLERIAIPRIVTYIGEDAFLGCTALSGVYVDDLTAFLGIAFTDADANPLTYAHSLYLGGILVTELAIPTAITELLPYALSGCTSLTHVIIPEGVTRIGHSALLGCKGLERLDIPFVGEAAYNTENTHFGHLFGATSYEEHALLVPSSLRTVVVTGGATVVSYAFRDCPSLVSVSLPASVTIVGEGAFLGCRSMESLTLPFLGHTEGDAASGHLGYSFGTTAASANRHYVPETLKSLHIRRGRSLAPSAFFGCVALREIDLPSELTSIGSEAFSGCVSLTAVKIGKNVSSIAERAFSGCSGVLTVTVDGQNTTYHSEGNCLIETSAKTLIFGCRRSVIPSDGSVKIIASYAFEGCTGLSAITLPDELYLIRPYAFLGCDSLATVTFEVAHRWLISLSSDYSQPMAQYTVDEEQNAASLTDRYARYYWFQNKIFDEGAQ